MIAANAFVSSISSSRRSSSFDGELTRVEIGQIVMGSDGNGRNRSRGSGSFPSQRS